MSGPKPLFDKKKEEQLSSARLVGKFTVTDSVTGKELTKDDLNRMRVPGTFVPPPAPPQKVVKPAISPAPLFKSTKTAESDITPEDKVKFSSFDNRTIMRIKDAAEEIDLTDRVQCIQYGQELNKKLLSSVDTILNYAKNNSLNDRVASDVAKLKSLIDFDPNHEEKSLMGIFKKKKTVAEKIGEVVDAVENVAQAVDSNVKYFLNIIPKFDELLDESKDFHTDLMILIAAGKERIAIFTRRRKPRLDEKLASNSMIEAQNARDEYDIFNTFVKRVETLELTLGQNEITLAQIRLSQANNVKMVETLNNIVTNLIPMWKHSLISAMSSNNFDSVNKNKELLSKSICDIIPQTAAN